jgi:hypothetical protein
MKTELTKLMTHSYYIHDKASILAEEGPEEFSAFSTFSLSVGSFERK